jgi:hypothetical protein
MVAAKEQGNNYRAELKANTQQPGSQQVPQEEMQNPEAAM